MSFRTEVLGKHITLRKGLSYKGTNLVEYSEVGLLTIDAFIAGGGYKRGSEKPFDGEYRPEHLAEAGDVLLAMTEQQEGLLASPLKVPEDLGGMAELVFSLDVAKVISTSGAITPEFLFNFLRVPLNRTRAAYGDTGTTVQRLPYEVIYEQVIPVPSLEEQDRINSFIAALDRKIQLNTSMAETLEKIAQSVFRSWFIDFDPVRAKMSGVKPVGMNDATTALFPDSMEDSQLGLIPMGWDVRKIGSLCETLLGGTPSRSKTEFWGGDIPWINSGKVNDFRITTPSEYITREGLEKSATKLLPTGTTVIAITGATLGQFSRIEMPACANQSVVGIIGSSDASNEFIYSNIASGIQRLIAAQTGGAQQHINKEDVNNFAVIYPGRKLVDAFTSVVQEMFLLIGKLSNESLYLKKMRDSLLPRLISGELQIPEELLVL